MQPDSFPLQRCELGQENDYVRLVGVHLSVPSIFTLLNFYFR